MADGPFNSTHEQYGGRFLSAPGDFIDSSRFSLLCRPFPLYYGRGSSLSTSHGDRVCFSLAGTGLHIGGHTFSLSDKRPFRALSGLRVFLRRSTFLISGSWLSSSLWKDCRIPVTWSCFSSCVSASSGYCLFLEFVAVFVLVYIWRAWVVGKSPFRQSQMAYLSSCSSSLH